MGRCTDHSCSGLFALMKADSLPGFSSPLGFASGGPRSFRRGKKTGKESRQREPISMRFPLETLPDDERGSAPFEPQRGTEDGG